LSIKQNDVGDRLSTVLLLDGNKLNLSGCSAKLFIRDSETLSVAEITPTIAQKTVTLLTSSGALATATATGHGLVTGETVNIVGASGTLYNGDFVVTVLNANQFTYQLSATGTNGTIAPDVDVILLNKGKVKHDLTADDTAVPGTFFLEWEVTFPDGKVKSIPQSGYDTLTILRDLG
jgi:hypothetical protein